MDETKTKTKLKFNKKETLITGAIGIVMGIAITCLVGFVFDYFAKSAGLAKLKYGDEVVATVNGKGITATEIYETLKNSNGLSVLISKIDKNIMDEMYNLTEEEEEEAKEQADYYLSYYSAMGYTEEEFLSANGFASYDEFLDDIRLSLKSSKYLYDYLEGKLENGAVENYYNEHKSEIETYDSEHVLVKITDDVTDEQALALINEILAKVNEGKTFAEIEEEYGDQIVHEELGFQGQSSSLESAYIDALVAMEDGTYSTEPVKTSYGYHIIHKIKTSTMEDLRETIIETLSEDLLEEDPYISYKAFDELRKDKNLEIYDENLKKQYEEYINELNTAETDKSTNTTTSE